MWNSILSGTKSELLALVMRALADRLPASWRLEEAKPGPSGGKFRPDAVVRVRAPDGTQAEMILEIKSRLEPRDVPMVVDRVRRMASGRALWIAAPFLSPRTRERLKQERVCYSDSTGNAWLVSAEPALFVETTGAEKDPRPLKRELASLKGRAAGRVVRALCDFKPPYGIRQLAERARTPLGSVARVVALLDREAVVSRNPKGGVQDVDVDALVRRWTADYAFPKSNRVQMFLEPRGLGSLLKSLEGFQARYAVTGSLATVGKTSVALPRLAAVYVDDIATAADGLRLRAVETGANVLLARPFDPVVYERESSRDGLRCACASQVAADLLTSPGRGPAEGNELLRWMKENRDAWGGGSLR